MSTVTADAAAAIVVRCKPGEERRVGKETEGTRNGDGNRRERERKGEGTEKRRNRKEKERKGKGTENGRSSICLTFVYF